MTGKLVGKWFVWAEVSGYGSSRIRYEHGQIVARIEDVVRSDQFLVRVEPVEGSVFPYPIHRVEAVVSITRSFALFETREAAEAHLKTCLERAPAPTPAPDQEMN